MSLSLLTSPNQRDNRVNYWVSKLTFMGKDVLNDFSYALPGRPVAMMMFKTWGYIVRVTCITLHRLTEF